MGEGSLMSHLLLCRLPSLPLSRASRLRIESRREEGRRGGVMPAPDAAAAAAASPPTAIFTRALATGLVA